MKSLLVPVETCKGMRAQLATALLVATRFGGHIDGVAPRVMVGAYALGNGMGAASAAIFEQFDEEEKARAEGARRDFREFMAEQEVAWGDPLKPSKQPTADWLPAIDPGDEVVAELARLYDATVLLRPVREDTRPRASLLETVLFESGRPVLVAPPDVPEHLGKVILIAWNGSMESARSISFAQPLLVQAERVVVLAVEGGSVPGPKAAEVGQALLRGGIAAEVADVQPEGQTVGEAILAEAGRIGADLLVKGAYTHSRLRQMIFGGATSQILNEAELPILIAH